MKSIIYKADSRGKADHGWLHSRFSFSFAEYNDPSRVHFGLLRVLNDDTVAAGTGFGMHPHDNMEIVTIALKGEILHKDNTGNQASIKAGEVQIMSAGTGLMHSEMASKDDEIQLLQIWVFPKERNIKPRYDQKVFDEASKNGRFQTLVSPVKTDETLWINQDAWFSIGNFDKVTDVNYDIMKADNGLFVFVIEGGLSINNETLDRRDAMGITEASQINMKIKPGSEILLIDVPMGY